MRQLRIIFLTLLILGMAGCASMTPRYDELNEGQWTARALVKDNKTGRSAVIHLDIRAQRDERLRVDVTAAMGHPVASIVWRPNQVNMVLIEQKKYYLGTPSPKLMSHILRVPMEIEIWQDIVFDRAFTNKNWTCSKDKKGLVADCMRSDQGTKVVWSDRYGPKRTVTIEHTEGRMQVLFQGFKPKVENPDKAFELIAPKNFKKLAI